MRIFACESLGGQNPELYTKNTIAHLSNLFLEIYIYVSILGLLFGIGINLRKHILAVGPKKSPS